MELNVDPREALAVGAIASDLLRPQRVEDLEAFLAQYPHVAQYIEDYLGFGYASIPPQVVAGLNFATQVPEGLLSPFGEVANAEGNPEPEQGPDAGLLGP